MSPRATRLAGAGILMVALGVGAEAVTFRVGFPTDPLGPAAFPLLAAGLLALGGLALLMEGGWGAGLAPPEGGEAAMGRGGRMAAAAAAFLAYAVLLPLAGFIPATTAVFAGLAVLFGGPVRDGLLAGLVFALALFALFVWVLGLPLPVWPWPMGA